MSNVMCFVLFVSSVENSVEIFSYIGKYVIMKVNIF